MSDIATGRVVSDTDALSKTTSYQYDSFGRATRVTAPEGNYLQLGYDARGNLIETRSVAKAGSGLADVVRTASFDLTCSNTRTCNKPNSATDPKGATTDFTYDPTHGGVLTATLPAASSGAVRPQTRYSYATQQAYYKNGAGSIVASTPIWLQTGVSACQTTASCAGAADESKVTIGYQSGAVGVASNLLPVSVTRAAGNGSVSATTAMSYDVIGNLKTVDGPLAGAADTATYRYDAVRRPVGVVGPDPDGGGVRKPAAQRTTYNSDGQVTLQEVGVVNDATDPNWTGFASQEQVATSYDTNSRPIKSELKAGGTTYAASQTSYDALGRVDCGVQRMNPAAFGALPGSACTPGTPGTDGPDRIVKNTYDEVGRIKKVQTAVGAAEQADEVTTAYTNNGKTDYVIDAESNRTDYSYDGHDRLVKTEYPSTTKGANTANASDYEQLGYDPNGNVTSRRLRDGQTIGYGHDNLNRVTSIDLPNTVFEVHDKGFGYDLPGNLTSATMTNGWNNSFVWDALGRQVQENAPLGIVTRSFDAAGRMTSETLPGGGLVVNYDYDVTGNATAVRENGATSGVGVLASYSYDDLGRRLSVTFGNGTSQTYAYDPVSRLSSLGASFPATPASSFSNGFTYSPASQIASTTRSNDSYAWTGHYNVDRNYGVNGLNQLSPAGTTTLGYDGRGNLTTSGSGSYGYGPENLLATSSVGGTSRYLAYDAMGRLGLVMGDATNSTRLDYSSSRLISERDWYGNLLRRYVHGPGTDQPIVWYEGTGTSDRRFLMTDERGSVVSVTNSAGSTININSYDEYGIPGSGNIGRFGYTGQAWIPELGMWYYKARIYSPTLGRFMQTDPIGYNDGTNWYNYVRSDPINRSDPSGLINTRNVSFDGGDNATIVVSGLFCHGCGWPAGPYESVAFIGGLPLPFGFDLSDYGVGANDIVVTAQKPEGPPNCPAGPRIIVGLGAGGTVFGLPIYSDQGLAGQTGLSDTISIQVAIPVTRLINPNAGGRQIIIKNETTGLVGLGLYGGRGGGAIAGVASGPLDAGWTFPDMANPTHGYQAGAAYGGGAEVNVSTTDRSATISGSLHGGGGAYGGPSQTHTTQWVSGCF